MLHNTDMEKRKWLWKRKSSEKSPGETESSESVSSHSDDQEPLNASPNHNSHSPEVISKPAVTGKEINDSLKVLTEKLSAALANVSAKEDLVKQHAKVAEEAVAGWEKAENEVAVLKQQLESEVQQNSVLEDRVSHLDRALKECVRQLRQGKEEQKQKIHEAVLGKTREWETTKIALQNQIFQFQTQLEAAKCQSPPSIDPDLHMKIEYLEKENSALTCEIISRSEELEIRTIERDLSAEAAETASKQHLESIKKVAKLEAECRRLQAVAKGKSSLGNDQKSLSASSICVESLTDSQSDSGERLNGLEIGNSWASALITELDQFKNEKNIVRKSISSPLDIEIMDDFLEMERLASLPEANSEAHCPDSVSDTHQIITEESPLIAELEVMSNRVGELEEKLMQIEVEKAELEKSLSECQGSLEASQGQFKEAEMRLEELQKELTVVNESKELLEFQLIGMDVEARTMISKVESLKEEVEKERSLAVETAVKCRELVDELTRKSQEIEIQQIAISNSKPKVTQDDLDGAAGKLAECQKTIASLGRQLQSLATLEDFLTDTANLPGFSGGGSSVNGASELWKLHSNDTFTPKSDSNPSKMALENSGPSVNGNGETSSVSSSSSTLSSVSLNHVSSAKSQNGFGKLFSRSKSGIKLENHKA
ncbi:filament-like plant protein [Rhododendron vialii]|uniref:filament-like plant protein n=1 Tax=Rhododendron vialii TaxID=182163 RepID=UPI002660140B|nr:filament-like plant protein [Rhododendron vialii]XP_058218162.1 filament-like plant protein [Rhododendron vialii]XP_058218163.1 filament-like plant protein [Rhododendron vialii]XP_058218164.1 filament-like plant protein [Rhododendron vialii]